jgi:hypothetical protein
MGFANAGGDVGFVSQTVGDNQTKVLDLFRQVEVGFIVE